MISSPTSFVSRSLFALALLAAVGLPLANAAKGPVTSPDGLWQLQAAAPSTARVDQVLQIQTERAQTFVADLTRLRETLAAAPFDKATTEALGKQRSGAPVEITLPMPGKGALARFQVVEVAMMEPALAARYPGIKTYRGVGVDDPSASLALDVTPFGLHAQIMSPNGWVYISPYYFAGSDDLYASYFKRDAKTDPDSSWVCFYKEPVTKAFAAATRINDPETTFAGSLRTCRLAVAANHQYVATTGGTVQSGLTAIITVINRVSAIFESETAVRLVVIANDDQIIYPSATGDPFTANDTTVINTSTAVISAAVGAANYDIGHVFTTGSGGVSGLGVVCNTSSKGRSTTGLPTPVGDAYNVDYVVHEMGHQFGANHTFNGNTSNCGGGNRSAAHAYEPGSGSTIMAYAGICGVTSDLQPHSDAYFHSESISEILTYTAGTGGTCPVVTTSSDTAPVVNAGPDYVIPTSTPFTLTGSATDLEGDAVTYCWEERDKGAAQAGTAVDNGAAPIFRSFNPVYGPSRTFPKVSDLLNNTTTIGEQLPTVARAAMTFRLTVRDNRSGGGGTNSDDAVLTVVNTGSLFRVTSPNTAITAAAGSPLTVSWNVAGTDAAPISTTAVNILLSVDGGYTYPITLAANTANDGTETVTLPAGVSTTTARVKVAAANSIYFDISDTNFTIN